MNLQEIKKYLSRKIAPKVFRLDSDIYGLQYDKKKSDRLIRKVVLTMDLSLEMIYFAVKNKIGLIIANNSLIHNPINKFNFILINKLSLLSKYPISIYVLSSSFIGAEGGISDTLVRALYFKLECLFEIKNKVGINIPIGRICSPLKYVDKNHIITLEDILNRIKTNLNMKAISYIGDLNKPIKKICVVGGDNSKISFITKAVKFGCDCYISGKINYGEGIFARDIGINLIEISTYKKGILTLKKLCNILSLEFPHVEFFLFESKDPFKTYF
ncbi:hypothetical protein LCGC14_0681020 [marine sediment metagenome]|uniref:GTP cyclohydrolase 1 type 2 homolog n=1 Tax=marine sediment metagenome TaxID=412755 RepID=A0A0F9T9H6_9ZZZZ